MYKWFLLLFSISLLLSCSDEKTDDAETDTPVTIDEKPTDVETIFTTNIDFLRLRETKGKGGNVIEMLDESSVLIATGEVSLERSEEVLRGIRFNEPWVQVKTKQGKTGWVYGGALTLIGRVEGRVGRKILRDRLNYFFGEELGKKIYNFRNAFEKKQTSNDFAITYKTSSEIIAAANNILKKKALINEKNQLPDLSWVTNRLPGHVVHKVYQNGAFQLFRDYQVFADRSKKTLGKIDDSFFNLCLKIFDVDSIEYVVPGWQMDVPQTGIVSLLGKGIHYDVLKKMNAILSDSDVFEKEINTYKIQLLDDLIDEHAIYWYSKDKILKELDALIDSKFGILTKNDLIALKTRRGIIAKATGDSIRMNLRAGR